MNESVQDLERKLFEARLAACSDLESRFAFVVSFGKDAHGYWSRLEGETGISAQRWRKVVAERQRPTPDMIEVLARRYPDFAFWLVTGALPTRDIKHRLPAYTDTATA